MISRGFWMGTMEVTQRQWRAVMVAGNWKPSTFEGHDHPVETVSWEDAREFCQKLTKATDLPIRLPTEAEWEYACRAGATTDYDGGDGEQTLKKSGWFTGNSGRETHPVGQKAPNRWNLHDMHGNVWEWCQDLYSPAAPATLTDPVRSSRAPPEWRVLRGGAWSSEPGRCTAGFRLGAAPETHDSSYGFRVCFTSD
jgi:formylglycine-generating enzyme required for sulfatase activity